jgi:hypothetical protein
MQYIIEAILMIYGINLSSIKELILACWFKDNNEYAASMNSMSIA